MCLQFASKFVYVRIDQGRDSAFCNCFQSGSHNQVWTTKENWGRMKKKAREAFPSSSPSPPTPYPLSPHRFFCAVALHLLRVGACYVLGQAGRYHFGKDQHPSHADALKPVTQFFLHNERLPRQKVIYVAQS